MTHPGFQLSAESKTLAQVLREAAVGDVVAYAHMSASIGRDVRTDGRSAMETARRVVLREDRMVFDAVRSEGLQRLNDAQIVALSDRTRDHIRRSTRKTARALTCVNYDSMKPEQQVKHNTALSLLGVIGELSTDKAAKRLESKVQAANAELPAAKAAIAALGSVV